MKWRWKIVKINENKSWFSEKLKKKKKKDKPLARPIKEERERDQIKSENFLKKLKILSYNKHTNYHKSNTIICQKTDKLEEIDKLLETYHPSRLNQEELENMIRTIMSNEIEPVILKSPSKQKSRIIHLYRWIWTLFTGEVTYPFQTSPKYLTVKIFTKLILQDQHWTGIKTRQKHKKRKVWVHILEVHRCKNPEQISTSKLNKVLIQIGHYN